MSGDHSNLIARLKFQASADRVWPEHPMMLESATALAALVAERDALRKALEFYRDPVAWKKQHDPNDDVRIPDFYSETDFGETARAALSPEHQREEAK